MGLTLAQALRLKDTPAPRVAFVGAGGKTTALFQLAREISPCIVTTTTHLGVWQAAQADLRIILRPSDNLKSILDKQSLSGVILVSGAAHNKRLGSLTPKQLSDLERFCSAHTLPLLIEADGARGKALKAPTAREPVIPPFVNIVVVVAGLSGIGKFCNRENVYNAEAFARLGKIEGERVVTAEALVNMLTHPEGGLKNIPSQARRAVLLNQADTPKRQALSGKIAEKLLSHFNAAISANLQTHSLSTCEPVAAILLAAGESSRFGQPKQLLDYHGIPFVRAAAETALGAGLNPVVVVTGADHGRILTALAGLNVKIAHNPNWRDGQSSSIKIGVSRLPSASGAAIFLLADQPQVTRTVIRALIEEHRRTLHPVIAPMVEDRRANPVLFDKVTFPALLTLQGDVGGRGIFSKFSPSYIPWLDSALLLDVDTPEAYRKLMALP